MLNILKNWKGSVEVNGKLYNSIADVNPADLPEFSKDVCIRLYAENEKPIQSLPERSTTVSERADKQEYRVTVRKYMTRKSNGDFDFMLKWNNDVPMPMMIMTGTKEKETKGMVYMNLHGDVIDNTSVCMCCGRELTNPVSRYFGIGPECGGHNYVNPFNSDEELKAAVDEMRTKLRAVKWSGWIIKGAITREEEVN